MKRLFILGGHLLAILSIVILIVKLNHHFDEIPDFNWGLGAVSSFISAVIFSAASVALGSYIWVILLRSGGVFLNFKKAYIINGQSQIGKYLPGNVFQYVGRIALGRMTGLPAEALVLSIGAETLVVTVTAATIAIVGLLFGNKNFLLPAKLTDTPWLSALLAIGLSIATVACAAVFSQRIREWLRPRLTYLKARGVVKSAIIYVFIFAGYGVCITLLLRTLWIVDTDLHWYQFAWGFALAWVSGFIVPGAPAGIGIREVVLVGLFGPVIGDGVLVELVLLLRVATSLGDFLAFCLSYCLGKRINLLGFAKRKSL